MSWSLDRRAEQEHPELLDVRNREHLWVTGRTLHRILDGHLPAHEQVRELLMGAVGTARAVLAVTDTSAVLAAEPQGAAPASVAQVPLREVTAVEWSRHGNSGSVVVRAPGACLVLKHVELRHGPDVVERLRDRWIGARSAAPAQEPANA